MLQKPENSLKDKPAVQKQLPTAPYFNLKEYKQKF